MLDFPQWKKIWLWGLTLFATVAALPSLLAPLDLELPDFLPQPTVNLGLDLAVRVWDGYMVFGTPYLTQVALGILNICRNDILRGDFGTCLRICLRDLPASITEDMLFDSIDAMG